MSSGTIRALQLEPSKGIRAPTAAFRTVRVDGVSGHLCDVKLGATGNAKDLMLQIMQETGTNWREQTLVVGTRVMEPNDPVLANNVVMVRRSMAHENYLKMLRNFQPPFHLRARVAPRIVARCIPERPEQRNLSGISAVKRLRNFRSSRRDRSRSPVYSPSD